MMRSYDINISLLALYLMINNKTIIYKAVY